VTDEAQASAPAVATVRAVLADVGLSARMFSGVHPNPTTDDVAAGAAAVAEVAAGAAAAVEAAAVAATLRPSAPLAAPSAPADPAALVYSPAPSPAASPGPAVCPATRIALVAVGGGSPIDAAKGIAIAAVNPERGRDLDYRRSFTVPALPIVAVPTTAGPGAETNAFGVVTDPAARRKFYVGHASSMPAAIGAIAALRDEVGLGRGIGDFGITEADFGQIAADTLDDEVLADAPSPPCRDDIHAILLASAG
jgi:alcohol dehydrogenase class IV